MFFWIALFWEILERYLLALVRITHKRHRITVSSLTVKLNPAYAKTAPFWTAYGGRGRADNE